MTAFNVVRMRPKKGQKDAFLKAHREREDEAYPGMRSFNLVDVGNGEYVIVGEWDSMAALAAARPQMIGTLDKFRGMLEDLGGDLGVTDPRSGEAVVTVTA